MIRFLSHVLAVAEVEGRKLLRDPTEVLMRAVQPLLWLLVFGQVMSRVRDVPTGGVSYLAFLSPGILAQSVLFGAIFYGISVIWERDLGVVHKVLVSPASRTALVLGKALASGFRGMTQAVIIYCVAFAIGVELRFSPLSVLGVVAFVFLGSAAFSTFSLVIACIVKTRERFMGIGQVLTMPLFFASNAIYPIELMPPWLQAASHANPLTYLVDALRELMLRGAPAGFGLGLDLAVLLAVFASLTAVAARLYPTLVQ